MSDLERIRKKVEEGERLSDAELEQLRAAAQAQPGPTLRLAVAHALVNNGDAQTALSLLEKLVRDFPRDLQSWLGLARAQMAMERTQDAERALRQALSLSPDDPEALKVLALIALGRGEYERARQWVQDVLRRDPFDSEAQLIKAELDAPGQVPAPPSPGETGTVIALRPEFTRALLRALRQKGVQAAAKDDALLVQPPNAPAAKVDLRSLYGAYLAEHRPLQEAVSRIADGIVGAALGMPASKDELLHKVLPVLRPASFAQVAPGAAHREGPAGVLVFYVVDDPELVRYVPKGTLDARALSVDDLDRAAFAALERRTAKVQRVGVAHGKLVVPFSDLRLYAVAAEDGHDGARLLTKAQRDLLHAEVGLAPWRVGLVHREAALVCRLADAEACAAMDAVTPSPDGIEGRFVLTREGALDFVR